MPSLLTGMIFGLIATLIALWSGAHAGGALAAYAIGGMIGTLMAASLRWSLAREEARKRAPRGRIGWQPPPAR